MIGAIEATIDALVPFPYQGHRRPDLTSRPLRFTSVGNYLIVYVRDKGAERAGCEKIFKDEVTGANIRRLALLRGLVKL